MKKKILPFILVLIVLIVCSIFTFYIFMDNKNDIPATDVINKENVVNDSINTPSNQKEIKKTQDEEKQTNHDVDIKEEKSTSKKEQTTNQTTHKSNISIKEEVSSNGNEEVPPINNNDDKEIIVNEEINNSDTSNENEEDLISHENKEFERLQSLIKYKTDKECYDASFDVTLEYIEDENFKVISCISYAYKGRLVGYRMIVHFWDGTTKYLDAIN